MPTSVRDACERLLHDYAWTQDNADPDAFAALFADDAEWHRPSRAPLIGRAAILDNARSTFRPEKLLHFITNFRFDHVDSEAASTCYSLAFQGADSGAGFATNCQPVAAMIYRNRFRRENSAWRIILHQTEFVFRA